MPPTITRPLRRALWASCFSLLVAASGSNAQTAGGLAFVGVNVVPMDSERVLTRHTVVVQGDRIIAIDPADDASVPPGARRIEAEGKYLIPGLIDAHAYPSPDALASAELLQAELATMVANGITTVRYAIGAAELLGARRRLAAEDAVVPELHVSSPELFSLPRDEPVATRFVQTSFEAAAAVRQYREAGYDFIAVSRDNTDDVYQGIVLTARGSGLPLVGRLPAGIDLVRALEAGQQIVLLDGYLEALTGQGAGAWGDLGESGSQGAAWADLLEQIDEGRVDDLAGVTADTGVWNIPLLAAVRTALDQPPSGLEDLRETARRMVSAEREASWRRMIELDASALPGPPTRRRFLELRDRLVRALHRAGARLLAGSGEPGWLPPLGFGLHLELAALTEAGLPPYAALDAATRGPAEFVSFRGGMRAEYAIADEGGIRFSSGRGAQVDFGRIDVGLRADLVLLGANPLDDIAHTRRIEGVALRGRWLPRDELDRLQERAAELLGGTGPRNFSFR